MSRFNLGAISSDVIALLLDAGSIPDGDRQACRTRPAAALIGGADQIPLVTSPPTSNTEAMKVRCTELAGNEADDGRNEFPLLRGRSK